MSLRLHLLLPGVFATCIAPSQDVTPSSGAHAEQGSILQSTDDAYSKLKPLINEDDDKRVVFAKITTPPSQRCKLCTTYQITERINTKQNVYPFKVTDNRTNESYANLITLSLSKFLRIHRGKANYTRPLLPRIDNAPDLLTQASIADGTSLALRIECTKMLNAWHKLKDFVESLPELCENINNWPESTEQISNCWRQGTVLIQLLHFHKTLGVVFPRDFDVSEVDEIIEGTAAPIEDAEAKEIATQLNHILSQGWTDMFQDILGKLDTLELGANIVTIPIKDDQYIHYTSVHDVQYIARLQDAVLLPQNVYDEMKQHVANCDFLHARDNLPLITTLANLIAAKNDTYTQHMHIIADLLTNNLDKLRLAAETVEEELEEKSKKTQPTDSRRKAIKIRYTDLYRALARPNDPFSAAQYRHRSPGWSDLS